MKVIQSRVAHSIAVGRCAKTFLIVNYLSQPNIVPDKVFRIHEADEDELGAIDQQMRDSTKGSSCNNAAEEEEFWWNRVNLTALDLSSNSLTSISGEIKNLVDLLTFNVSRARRGARGFYNKMLAPFLLQVHDNALTELPDEIAALERLTKANFSHNKLTCLPEPFYRLKDLTTLNLSHNKFVELNADISDLVMLDTLVSLIINCNYIFKVDV